MRISFAAALMLASISAPAAAQVGSDTLADAVTSAIGNNPVLMAERKTRGLADETLAQARAGLRPSIGFSSSYGSQGLEYGRSVDTPTGSFPLDGWQERATVGLEARHTLYAGGSLAAQRDQAVAGVKAAEARLRGAEQDLVLAVVTAFVDVQRAEREVGIRETNVSSLKQHVQAANDRFTVGEVTRTDVAQAQARESGSVADLAEARSALGAARASYEQIVGRPPVQLAEPPMAPRLPGTVDEAIAIAKGLNPQLIAARAEEIAAEEGIDIAKGGLAPRLGIVGSAGLQETYQDNSFRDTNLGLVAELSIPLFQGGLLNSKTRAARLNSDRARYQRMAVERDVNARVTTVWHAAIAAREAIAASSSRVAAAQVALDGAKRELEVGTRITLDVLDQERELLEAQLELVDAERSAYIAVHRLLAEMGRLSPESIAP